MPGKKGSSKREVIDTGKDKRFVRRDEEGRLDVSRSLSQDVQREAQNKSQPGQGDRGDRDE